MLIALGTMLSIQACKKDQDTVTEFTTIKGIVMSANLKKPIANALVYADTKTSGYSTRSAKDGKYELKVPVGNHTIYIETGDGSIFQSSFEVNTTQAGNFEVPLSESRLECRGTLAFIHGAYDQIQTVIQDTLGYPITEIFPNDLETPGAWQQYDAIFINCGANSVLSTNGYTNLGDFVSNGGSLYVSDFAMEYLIGYYDGSCAPVGGFIDDSKVCTAKSGNSGLITGCSVLNANLQAAIGSSSIDLTYDLGGWEQIVNYDVNYWNVWVADPSGNPLLLQTGQYSNGSGSGLPGNIYFTTFHNEANSIGSDVADDILQYIIVNI
jgi:hypothetical protein